MLYELLAALERPAAALARDSVFLVHLESVSLDAIRPAEEPSTTFPAAWVATACAGRRSWEEVSMPAAKRWVYLQGELSIMADRGASSPRSWAGLETR